MYKTKHVNNANCMDSNLCSCIHVHGACWPYIARYQGPAAAYNYINILLYIAYVII